MPKSRKPIRNFFLRLMLLVIGAGALAGLALVGFSLSLLPSLPPIEAADRIALKLPLRIYSRDGLLLAEFGDERRKPVAIGDVPRPLIQAVLAAEDDNFYRHPGIDLSGIARAVIANLRPGSARQGASTITMQVARNYFLTPEKTYTRKMKEILLAFRLEQTLSKDQILELYLNKIFLGHRAYGFAAAAQVYYGESLDQLTLAQLAMLAALPKAPSRNNPITNPETAEARRDYVLRRMLQLDYITAEQYRAAAPQPLTASYHGAVLDLEAPYVSEMARRHMVENYGASVYEKGYNVYTTVSARLQLAARRALRKGLRDYDRRHGYRGPAGRIDLAQTTEAERRRLLQEHPAPANLRAALVTEVGERSADIFLADDGEARIPWRGLAWARAYVDTETLGPKLKRAADVVAAGDVILVRRSGNRPWELAQPPAINGALVSIDTDDGAIKAVVGGYDFYQTKFNRALQAERQPGSNIKPFIYSAALEKNFTAATPVSGGPIVAEDESIGNIWRPENYTGRFFGPTPLRKALSLSINLVSVRILRAINPRFAIEHMEKFGFDREDLPGDLSLALGTPHFTPLEVVTAYAVLANGGHRVTPYLVSRIEDRAGRTVYTANPPTVCEFCVADGGLEVENGDGGGGDGGLDGYIGDSDVETAGGGAETDGYDFAIDGGGFQSDGDGAETAARQRKLAPRVLSAENAFLMNSLLRQVVQSGTGQRAKSLGRRDLAGKTGTTNNFHDAWFSGFTRGTAATVWMGFDQASSLGRGEAGSRVALPAWIDYMRAALRGEPQTELRPPDNITAAWVDQDSGAAAVENAPNGYLEYFIAGTEPGGAGGGGGEGEAGAPSVPTAPLDTEGLF
ncbi:MAG: PBP1A family penicillin-binding protein [Gammaproteobacteria bacterium]|nr:PBP1A family penicillin-binding protein [Gammaproteobacteria bacterium]